MRLGILAALLAIVAGIAYWTVVRQREQARWVTGYQEASDSYERMHYADAEAQLRMLLPEANKPDNHRSALTMNLLALVYHAEGRRKEAEPLFEKAIHIFEKEGSTSLMDLAKACNNEGRIYLEENREQEAEPQSLLEQAVQVFERNLFPTDLSLAQGYLDLADQYRFNGLLKSAQEMDQKALFIQERAFGSDSAVVKETRARIAQESKSAPSATGARVTR